MWLQTIVAHCLEVRWFIVRIFKIPFDIKREEKIFGGYLSLRQVLYLMLAISSLGIFATPLNIIVKIIIITIIATFFLLCAFLKINEQNFDKLFLCATKYIIRRKKFKYERCLKW